MNRKNRIQWLDVAKGIAIFSVVLGHCMGYIVNNNSPFILKFLHYSVFTFVMPLFFSISGYLYHPVQNVHSFLVLFYKKTISLMIPYLFFSLFMFILFYIFNKYNSIMDVFTIFISPISYLWFLYALYLIFIILGLLDLLRINVYFQFLFCLLVLLVQTHFSWYGYLKNFNILTSTFGYIMFFFMGYVLKCILRNVEQKEIVFIKSKSFEISIIMMFIISVLLQYRFTSFPYPTNNVTLIDIPTKLFSVIVCYCIFINLSHNSFFNYFDKYGKYTLIIYLVHYPFIIFLSKILKIFRIIHSYNILILLFSVILSWIFSIILCKLILKHPIFNFIFYPRQYIDKFLNIKY